MEATPPNPTEHEPTWGVTGRPTVLDAARTDRTPGPPAGITAKGFPFDGGCSEAPTVRAAPSGLFEQGFSTPIATIRRSSLATNLEVMAAYSRAAGVLTAPHGKTTMSPQIFDAQLAHGAWGITVATPWQLRTVHAFGVRSILLANELVDPAALRWLARVVHEPDLTVLSYVDDPEVVAWGAEVLSAAGAQHPIDVLIEVGYPGGRTGTRSPEEADQLAAAVAASPQHRLVGVAGYEGGFGHTATDEVVDRVRDHLREVRATAERLADAGVLEAETVVLTAGGSSFFDLVVDELAGPLSAGRPVETLIRSGGVVSHDEGLYGEVTPFVRRPELRALAGGALEAAVEVWARVLSRPEAGLALLDVGKRDVPFDVQLPSVHRAYHASGGAPTSPRDMQQVEDVGDWHLVDTNDQHGYLHLPDDAVVAPGDLVVLGITHPCTFFDKWRSLPVVDDAGDVVDLVHTYF